MRRTDLLSSPLPGKAGEGKEAARDFLCSDLTALDSRSAGPAVTVRSVGTAFERGGLLAVPAVGRALKPEPRECLVGHLRLDTSSQRC